MRMNTNFWDLTFDRFLQNEYGSDCALGLSVEYSQDFVVPIYTCWTVCLYQCTHPPSLSMHMALLSPRSYCTHHTTGHVWSWCILLESTHNVSVRTAQSKCTAFSLTPTTLLNCPSSSLGSSWDRPPRSLPPLQRMVGLYSKCHSTKLFRNQ